LDQKHLLIFSVYSLSIRQHVASDLLQHVAHALRRTRFAFYF